MIDIHSHILAGLDDGAGTFEESLAMAGMAWAAETTDIVATPHANDEYRFDPEQVEAKIAELQAAIGPWPVIHYGCDFHLNPENLENALRWPRKYSIDHGGYLLVEFSDCLIPRTTDEIFTALIRSDLTPVITHPERNPLLRSRMDDLASWVAQGCLVQVTAQSLLGQFGRSAYAASMALMSRGLVHVVASDGHDLKHRPPVLREAREFVAGRFGQDIAERLCASNPRAILKSERVTRNTAKARRRYFPW